MDYEIVLLRNMELERLTGRVMFLEQELYYLNKRPQPKVENMMKDAYDPNKIKELERQLKLKDE